MTALLTADGMTVRRTSDGTVVLPPTDLRAGSGQVVVVTGASGAGKTTLLHALLDTLPPGLRRSAGTVRWQGEPVEPGRTARQWRRTRCGRLGQDPGAALHPRWRVDRLITEDLPMDRATRSSYVAEQLDRLGLPPQTAARRAGELSGGQAQRVALARALAADPALLVLDEPTSAMDAETATLVRRAVEDRRGVPGRCVIVVTHDADLFDDVADVTVRVGAARRKGRGELHDHPRTARTRSTITPLSAHGLVLTTPTGTTLLKDGHLDLPAGTLTAVLGPSGTGKTTLLHALVGRRPARSGTLLLHGTPLPAATRDRSRDQLRAVQLAGQSAIDELNPAHRVDRAVARPLSVLHGLDRTTALTEARAVLTATGLPPGSLRHRPRTLSGGQRQRVVLARALAARPDVLLLDEPTASLDADTARSVLDLLDRIRESGTAVLAVTHDPAVAARADTVLTLRDARLLPAPHPQRTELPHAR